MSSWVMTFRDGPLRDEPEHVFLVGEPWQLVELAPMPAGLTRPPHWVIVGGDGIGREEHPWPGQETYRLVETRPQADGDDVAVYEWEERTGAATGGRVGSDPTAEPAQ